MKLAFVIGWVFFALEAVFVASFFYSKSDAKVIASSYGMLLLPVLLLAGTLLVWAQFSNSMGLQYAGLLVVSMPFLLGAGAWATNFVNERVNGWSRDQAGRFRDARLNQIAKALDRKEYAAVEALVKGSPAVDWTAKDAHGKTLVEHAVGRVLADYSGDKSAEGVAILLRNGGPIPAGELVNTIFEGNTPGSLALLEVVLKAGVDPNSKDHFGEPLVHCSHTIWGREKLALLAQYGADLKVFSKREDRPQWTALMTAVYMRSWEPAVFLLEHGVPPAYQAPDGKSVATLLESRVAEDAAYRKSPEAGMALFQRELEKVMAQSGR